jgi:hypothetical protein
MNAPKTAIIVLTWNQKADTLECLRSLSEVQYDNLFTVLVDNGSADDTVTVVRQLFPAVQVVETGDNLGYVGGNNAGMEYALKQGADYVFILNNDTIVAPDFLSKLITYAESNPTVGMLGPQVFMYDRPQAIWFAGATLDRYGVVWHTRFGEVDEGGLAGPQESVYIPGCSVLVRRAVIDQIGMLDSRFFYLYEEVDWCYRARRAGYLLKWLPDSHIWHKEARAYGGTKSPRYLYYFTRNHLLFFRNNFAGRARYRYYFYKIQASYHEWLRYRRGPSLAERQQARAIQAGLFDFWRGKFGRCAYNFS